MLSMPGLASLSRLAAQGDVVRREKTSRQIELSRRRRLAAALEEQSYLKAGDDAPQSGEVSRCILCFAFWRSIEHRL